MRSPTRCVIFLACCACVLATPAVIADGDLGRDSSVRDPKLLFKFITIAPEACTSTTGDSGICYSSADCTTLEGTPEGTCAKGLGVCCLITRSCGTVSGFQETTFTNPSHPASETAALGGCQLRITPFNNNICQIRLDFDEFTLSQPDNEGDCDQDFLQVTGGSSTIPPICGDNSGQHLYVDVSPQFGSALINIDTSSASAARWNIRVTQIECNSADRAPAGCLQYFTETTGTISSFNFNPNNRETDETRQLSNQEYGICIQSQPGYCSITYRQVEGSAFSLSGDHTALAPGLAAPSIVGTGETVGDRCIEDYLLIPGGTILDNTNVSPADTTTADRYCGLSFPGVTSNVLPFNIFYVTNDAEASDELGDSFNQGFKLMYRMNAC